MSGKRSGLRKGMVVVGVLALVVPLLLAWAAPVWAANITVCDSGCDYTSIQDAVDNAGGGDVIKVYPGTYNEDVDLGGHSGALTLRTVNNAGNPTPGTATVDGGMDEAFYTSSAHDGNLTLEGFVVKSSDDDAIRIVVDSAIVIRNVTASNSGEDGIDATANGDVTISDCTANSNDSDGILVMDADDITISDCIANRNEDENIDVGGANGNVIISGCTANDSPDEEGIEVEGVDGELTITDCTTDGNTEDGIYVSSAVESGVALPEGEAEESELDDDELEDTARVQGSVGPSANGDVTISNCTADGNDEDGIAVVYVEGDVTITNCTATRNEQSGFDTDSIMGTLTIQACISMENDEGVDLGGMWEASGVLVNGNIICGNNCGVSYPPSQLNAEGNWWGCAGGPEAAGCDPICQEDGIAVDFEPWIESITSGASVDPVTVGQPTVVSFQFRGGPPAVYLGEGPGDLRGPAPFEVSTDNGALNGNGATVEEFVGASGTLEVTLVPSTEGTATVTVSGPCGLGELEGATVVVDVVAAPAQEEFVPEPGSVLLLGSGLMGLAGYAGLRLRKR